MFSFEFDKREMLAKAFTADNTKETEEDVGEDKMDNMETDLEKTEEPGNLEQAWQMFDLAKVLFTIHQSIILLSQVIYGKTKNEVKECESF